MRIDELRSLGERADEALCADTHAGALRLHAVHARVARARRRRTTARVGAVAAAVVLALTGVLGRDLLHRPAPQPADGPAPARLVGHPVPRNRTVEGFDYHYVRGVERTGDVLRFTVPRSDVPQTLSWASTGGRSVTVTVDGEQLSRTGTGTLESGTMLWPGQNHTVVLTADGAPRGVRLGVAVYARSATPPAGVGNGTTTFRSEVAGATLLGARLSDPGQHEISFEVPVPTTRLRFSDVCSGAPGATATVTVNGHVVSGAPCDQPADEDPGAGGGWFPDATLQRWGVRAGGKLTVTMRLTKQMGGTALASGPHAVMGAAVYQQAPAVATVAGWDVPRLTEGDGSTWTYATSAQSRPGERSLVLRVPASGRDRQVTVATRDFRNGTVRLYVDGQRVDDQENYSGPGAGSYNVANTLLAGGPHTLELRIRQGGGPRAVVGLVVSTRG